MSESNKSIPFDDAEFMKAYLEQMNMVTIDKEELEQLRVDSAFLKSIKDIVYPVGSEWAAVNAEELALLRRVAAGAVEFRDGNIRIESHSPNLFFAMSVLTSKFLVDGKWVDGDNDNIHCYLTLVAALIALDSAEATENVLVKCCSLCGYEHDTDREIRHSVTAMYGTPILVTEEKRVEIVAKYQELKQKYIALEHELGQFNQSNKVGAK